MSGDKGAPLVREQATDERLFGSEASDQDTHPVGLHLVGLLDPAVQQSAGILASMFSISHSGELAGNAVEREHIRARWLAATTAGDFCKAKNLFIHWLEIPPAARPPSPAGPVAHAS